MTVRQVIAALLADIPGAPFPNTVDTIKAGDIDQPVTGIVTTMFATYPSVAKASEPLAKDATEGRRGTKSCRKSTEEERGTKLSGAKGTNEKGRGTTPRRNSPTKVW